MCRSLQVVWTFIIFLAACRRHPLQVPPTGDVNDPVARSAAPTDAGDQRTRGGDSASDDNLPDLIEIVGTAPQLTKLPSVGKINISDHGETPLARGRWRVSAYVAVKDTPGVLKEIRALGMKATVPLSVAERKRRMQPSPAMPDGEFIRP